MSGRPQVPVPTRGVLFQNVYQRFGAHSRRSFSMTRCLFLLVFFSVVIEIRRSFRFLPSRYGGSSFPGKHEPMAPQWTDGREGGVFDSLQEDDNVRRVNPFGLCTEMC